jgi:Beta-propeller repeat
VDLETGNVYVADDRTQTIYVFGATGGSPADGVPSQITGVKISRSIEPSGIAIDNSCYERQPRLTGKECEEYDPSYGDLYVMDNENGARTETGVQKFKLNPGGEYELVGDIHDAQDTPYGVTVDSQGNIYVVSYFTSSVIEFRKIIEKVINGGAGEFQEHLEEISIPQHITNMPGYVAVDDPGDVYMGSGAERGGPSEGFLGVAKLKVEESGEVLSEEVLSGSNDNDLWRPVAVDSSTGAVYVGDGTEVAEYSSAGALQLQFGSELALGGSLGSQTSAGVIAIAVNSETGLTYVANTLHGDIDVFGPVIGPPVFEGQQPAVSTISRTSALIGGTVNPASDEHGEYYFQYVPVSEYERSATNPYRDGGSTAVESLLGGHAPETIERVELTGLRPGVTYDYRMVATNAAETTYGPNETFTTAAATPPMVATGPASEVTVTSATLSGVVSPRGLPTSYAFEIGTSTSYDGAKLFGNAGSSTGEVAVSVALQYLVPGVTYHYRLVATSFDGTGYGQDGTFTTPAASAPITQPATTPLIASPSMQFPSIAGAITKPVSSGKKTKKKTKAKKKHTKHKQKQSRHKTRARH